jgi:NTE family protein
MVQPTRVALALGSGGARGYAHIGAIQVIEERGYEVVGIAGSSMGALVGGLHAAGKLDDYTDWVRGLRQRDVVRLLDLSLSAPGAIRAEKILARVRDLLDGALIEDLPISFTAVATDLFARKEVWFQRGPVAAAIRASIAIPGVITPVMLNGRMLADGGVTNPVPIAPTSSSRADVTIAVSLGGESRSPGGGAPVQETAEARPIEEWSDRFRSGASQLLDNDMVRSVLNRFGGGTDLDPTDRAAAAVPVDPTEPVAADAVLADVPVGPADAPPGSATSAVPDTSEDPFDVLPAGVGKFDMMYQSLDAMQSVLTRYRLAGYPPDVLVTVPRDACRSLDFHRAAEMIELGRALTTEALDRAGLTAPPEIDAGGLGPAVAGDGTRGHGVAAASSGPDGRAPTSPVGRSPGPGRRRRSRQS